MTDLPTKSYLTSGTTTEAQFQSAIGDLYDVVAQMPSLGPVQDIEMSAGTITPTKGLVRIDTEGGANIDELDLIVPSSIGEKVIYIRSKSSARVVKLKHNQSGTGKMILNGGADLSLLDPSYTVALLWDATASVWTEMWRNFGIYTTAPAEIAAIKTSLALGTAADKNVGTSTGQLVLKENFGSAAFVNTGTSSGQVPLANQLGSLAFLSQITDSQLNASGVSPGTYTSVTVNAQGRVTAGTASTDSVKVIRKLKWDGPQTFVYTPSPGLLYATVELQAAGGAGAQGTNTGSGTLLGGGGGGAGGNGRAVYSKADLLPTPTTTHTIVLGANGVNGVRTGQPSTFGSKFTVYGGFNASSYTGGQGNSTDAPEAIYGGDGTHGSYRIGGGQYAATFISGNGGSSAMGGGGQGGGYTTLNGQNGRAPGSGGGGCLNATGSSPGQGAQARLVIIEYCAY